MNSTNTSGNRTLALGPIVLLAATLAVTWTAALMLTDKDSRTDKFFLSLVALSIGELFTFGYALVPSLQRRPLGGNAPSFMMGWVIVGIYDAGATVLVLVGLTSSIAYSTLVVLHLIWNLVALVMAVAGITGASKIASSETTARAQRASFVVLRNQFSEYCDSLARISTPEASPLRKLFESIREDLSMSSAESPSGSERAEQELYACLDQIGTGLAALEAAAANGGGAAQAAEIVSGACAKARQLIRRREDIIAQLR